jgi:hypothetical protein
MARAGRDFHRAARLFGDRTLCNDCYVESGTHEQDRLLFAAGDEITGSCPTCADCLRPACRDAVCGDCGFAPGCAVHDEGHHPQCIRTHAA